MSENAARADGSEVTTAYRRDVTVAIASRNTRRATELAIRSIRRTTSGPVAIWVGDCASTDGSFEMLDGLLRSGVIDRLDVADGRSHGAWVDFWRSEADSAFLLIADSDVELHVPGWLDQMVKHLREGGSGLVSVGAHGEDIHVEPNTFEMRTAARPEMYLLLLDHEATHTLDVSFDFAIEQLPDGDWLAWDTGARFAKALEAPGRGGWSTMPAQFGSVVTHWGALSYMTDDARLPTGKLARLRVRARRLSLEVRVAIRLRAARQGPAASPPHS